MSYVVKKIGPQLWTSTFSEYAHQGVFGEHKPKWLDRIDFALLAINQEDLPVGYMTCREMDAATVYWQYGGMFEQFRDTIASFRVYEAFRDYHRENYDRCLTYIENTNSVMLKMAAKIGFIIIGTRNFKGDVLLEHYLEFEEKHGN